MRRDPRVICLCRPACPVRGADGSRVLRLGRDLLAVSGDLTDTFGPKYAATNYGFLYIAQGVGSILGGPVAAFLKQSTGSWTSVFIIVAVLDAVTALLAVTALRKLRSQHLQAG
jgi:MFS family permease